MPAGWQGDLKSSKYNSSPLLLGQGAQYVKDDSNTQEKCSALLVLPLAFFTVTIWKI